MLFMNEWDIDHALVRFGQGDTPVLEKGTIILSRLASWADRNSDGWAYWPKPARAAKSLMELIQSVDRWEPEDATEAQLRKALTPIKSFLTRQGVDHVEVFDNYLTS